MSSSNRDGGGKISRSPRLHEIKPYHRPATKDDLYCVHCGTCIRNQVIEKRVHCPRTDCKEPITLMSGWGYQDWGRCMFCCRFTQRDHCFCNHCGRGNSEAIAKEKRLKAAEAQRTRILEKDQLAKLEKENAEKDLEIAKLRELVAAAERKHFEDLDDSDFLSAVKKMDMSSSGKPETPEDGIPGSSTRVTAKIPDNMDEDSILDN